MSAPCKADHAAADRILKAACKRVVEMARQRRDQPPVRISFPVPQPSKLTLDTMWLIPEPEPSPAETLLAEATRTADLLIGERGAA